MIFMTNDKPKTIICDIDGCLSHHGGNINTIHHGKLNILSKVLDTFKKWDQSGCNIILLTGRRESVKEETEKQLAEAGLFYDHLIMGMKNFPRVLINDRKPDSAENTAYAVNLVRNNGFDHIECGIIEKPWGKYETLLDSETCKVKRITIDPGQAPSYQYHKKREEHWVIISGEGEALVDDVRTNVLPKQTVFVGKEQKHQLRNIGKNPLVFIEIQTGEYFGEDDIVRIVDDYGRI